MSLIVPALEKRIYQEEEDLALDEPIPAGLRIRKTQHATTLHLFVEAVTEFNLEQVDYKEKCEERIHRIASIGEITFVKFLITAVISFTNYIMCRLLNSFYHPFNLKIVYNAFVLFKRAICPTICTFEGFQSV